VAGALAGEGKLNIWIVLATAGVAWMLGSVIGFVIGARGGRPHDWPGRTRPRLKPHRADRGACSAAPACRQGALSCVTHSNGLTRRERPRRGPVRGPGLRVIPAR
jgi:hypothetical protein